MFNILRENMTIISTLSYLEPGLPRFSWDHLMQVLSIDGKAIPLKKFYSAIHRSIDDVLSHIKSLFGDCPFDDILEHIDQCLDPTNPEMWFRERPQQNTIGTSLFTEPTNGFELFRTRLVEHMSKGDHYFVRTASGMKPKIGQSCLGLG